MRYFKHLFLLTALLLPTLSYAADTAASQLGQMLMQLTTLQANFAQTVLDNNGSALQQTSGQMALQRPGKFRWQTQNPSRQLLIADGQRVWFYDMDLSQVTVQKQQNTSKNSPAMLLSGSTATLMQNFNISQLPSSNPNTQIFKLTPKTRDDLFKSVQLSFQRGLLNKMQMQDNFGQTTVIQFTHTQTNLALNQNLFHFTAPKGVDVLQN